MTLRTLAIAYKAISENEYNAFRNSKMATDHLNYEIEKDGFILIAVAAINDALRPGVARSVALCHNAMVNVIMITGDDIRIAEAIAKNAGIINPSENYLSITGKEFI